MKKICNSICPKPLKGLPFYFTFIFKTPLGVWGISIVCIAASCNVQPSGKSKEELAKDSLIKVVQQRDSNITAYLNSFNSIQKGIDTLMIDEKLLKMHSAEKMTDTKSMVEELRAISNLVIKNQRELTELQRKLKKSNEQNQGLTDLGEELAKQLNEKDSELVAMQRTLVKTQASLATVVKQFNDSLNTIQQQRAQINVLQIKGNTVYYVIGTEKGLKDAGIIIESGGTIGLGKTPSIEPNANNSSFYTADLTTLKEVPLGGKFARMVTPHPSGSYRITTGLADKLIITDPEDFWSKTKYMVVLIK